MANFTAALRATVQDVQGLILSLDRSGMEEAPNRPGYLGRWRNVAPGLASTPMFRSSADAVSYPGGRLGHAEQFVPLYQPVLQTSSGVKRVKFARARSTHLRIPLAGAVLPQAARQLTAAFAFTRGFDATGTQVLVDDGAIGKLRVRRRDGSGNGDAKLGATTYSGASEMASGRHLIQGKGFTWDTEAVAFLAGSAAPTVQFPASGGELWLGARSNSGAPADALDGWMDAFHLWTRALSPKEVDFIWQVVGQDLPGLNSANRAPVSLHRWRDATGDLTQGQVPRVGAVPGADPLYKLVRLTTATALVQVAMAVNGLVLPDSELGGDLFTTQWVEAPGNPPILPPFTTDSGWSAVVDIEVNTPGHHCLQITRANGGSLYLHFDVMRP